MNALHAAVLAYITTLVGILVLKPPYFYNHDSLKEFGCKPDQCMAPYYIVSLVIGVLTYFLSTILNR